MGPVKTPRGVETVAERIRLIRRVLNPHGDGELSWPAFAKFAGVPAGTAKKWEAPAPRGGISVDSARLLAARLTAKGYDCTWEWIREGTEPTPQWAASTSGEAQEAPEGGRGHSQQDPEDQVMTRQAQARLVSEAVGRVVDQHEVVGVELRKVLIRMAGGLDALNHHEAAGEIYSLLVKLNDLDLGRRPGS